MRKTISLHISSWILLVVILTAMLHCIHESAYAMPSYQAAVSATVVDNNLSAAHQCPSAPLEQHGDYDGCDSCANCVCHAPLSSQPIHLSYTPAIMALHTVEPIELFPEVYLTKFIPPQNHA
jgi:hypothetical protein